MTRLDETHVADVVVLGAGAAGLTAALGLSGLRVHVLTKARFGEGGSSAHAQGGVAAAVGADDSPAQHAADTLAVAGGLADAEMVELLTREGPAAIERVVALGGRFDRGTDGSFALGREAAHSRKRILHARDATGAELVRALAAAVRRVPHVRVYDETFACELLRDFGRVAGLRARRADGAQVLHLARAVVLATGGIGRVYSHTTNPKEATGDGLALAARAGARLADLEFVQFHPTALAVGADPMPLLTEALRGRGAVVTDEGGRRFLFERHAAGEMAPRDVVARAIAERLADGHTVYLDAREALGDEFPAAFPTVFAACRAHGLDPRREPVPVAPAAHYHMGGVVVDAWGRASVPGLWACGEVASTGAHGANRLASNSLLEALVFGARVAQDVARALPERMPRLAPDSDLGPSPASTLPADVETAAVAAARGVMWEHVGLLRSEDGLTRALRELTALAGALPPGESEAHNVVTVGRLVATAALARRESRGSHFRLDHPEADPRFAHRLFLRGDFGAPALEAAS